MKSQHNYCSDIIAISCTCVKFRMAFHSKKRNFGQQFVSESEISCVFGGFSKRRAFQQVLNVPRNYACHEHTHGNLGYQDQGLIGYGTLFLLLCAVYVLAGNEN